MAENTLILYTLIREFGFAVLALEWAPEMEHTIARFLAGNLHTRVQPLSIDEVEEELVPMGMHLAARITPLMPGRIDCLSGSFHNIEPKRFPWRGGGVQGNRFFMDGHDSAVFVLGEAKWSLP